MTNTTLSVAISAPSLTPATQITLASVTGLTTSMLILVDGEYFKPTAINTTSLIVDVIRGYNGTLATTHGAGSPASFGTPDEFKAGSISPIRFVRRTPTALLATAGALTYTAGQLISRFINRDCAGASRTDTLPTAVLLVAALPGVQVNDFFDFVVNNCSDAAETITIAIGTGGTILVNTPAGADTVTVAQNTRRRFGIRFTGVAPGSEAYTLTDESGAVTY